MEYEALSSNEARRTTFAEKFAGWRLQRRRQQKQAVAPHLVFIDPNGIDLYTKSDLRAIGAFYKEAAAQEPDGKVYIPAQSTIDATYDAMDIED